MDRDQDIRESIQSIANIEREQLRLSQERHRLECNIAAVRRGVPRLRHLVLQAQRAMQSARTLADAKALSLSQAAVQNRAMSRSIQQGLYAWRRALFMGDGGGDAPPASPGPDKLQTPTEIREEVAELEMLTARRRRTVGLLVRQVAWSAGQSLQRATLASCWSAWRQRLRVGRMQVVLERQAKRASAQRALRVWAAAVRQQRLERFTTERVRRSVVERRKKRVVLSAWRTALASRAVRAESLQSRLAFARCRRVLRRCYFAIKFLYERRAARTPISIPVNAATRTMYSEYFGEVRDAVVRINRLLESATSEADAKRDQAKRLTSERRDIAQRISTQVDTVTREHEQTMANTQTRARRAQALVLACRLKKVRRSALQSAVSRWRQWTRHQGVQAWGERLVQSAASVEVAAREYSERMAMATIAAVQASKRKMRRAKFFTLWRLRTAATSESSRASASLAALRRPRGPSADAFRAWRSCVTSSEQTGSLGGVQGSVVDMTAVDMTAVDVSAGPRQGIEGSGTVTIVRHDVGKRLYKRIIRTWHAQASRALHTWRLSARAARRRGVHILRRAQLERLKLTVDAAQKSAQANARARRTLAANLSSRTVARYLNARVREGAHAAFRKWRDRTRAAKSAEEAAAAAERERVREESVRVAERRAEAARQRARVRGIVLRWAGRRRVASLSRGFVQWTQFVTQSRRLDGAEQAGALRAETRSLIADRDQLARELHEGLAAVSHQACQEKALGLFNEARASENKLHQLSTEISELENTNESLATNLTEWHTTIARLRQELADARAERAIYMPNDDEPRA